YFDGLLKAVRQNRQDFEHQYRFLGNRSIHASSIAVSADVYRNLRSYFIHKHRVQYRQFEGLDLIRKDIALIRSLAETGDPKDSHKRFRYRIKGAALFSPAGHAERISSPAAFSAPLILRKKVRERYGPGFIEDRKARIEQTLAGLRETAWGTDLLRFLPDRYPVLPYTLADRFADLLVNLTALEVIEYGSLLTGKARIEPDLPGFRLKPAEIEALRRFRNSLQQELLKLMASTRPDWGYPVLVGLARLTVLDESIRSGKLVLLDTFGSEPGRVDPDDIRRYRGTFERLAAEARNKFEHEKTHLLAVPSMDEADYSLLELSGNLYAELARGVSAGTSMRIHGGALAPSGMGDVDVPVLPGISHSRLLQLLDRLNGYAAKYFGELEQHYRYHLLTRNCVSEIFLDIERALAIQSRVADGSGAVETESVRRLGGTIDRKLWNSVPFISAAQVRSNFRVGDSRTLLSYRQKRLAEMYAAENPLIAYFRESNVLTSTLYPWNPDDGFFLFFTDDRILPRPLFGAFNLAAGIGQMLVGGVLSPLAGGDAFIGGLKGFVSSLPELSFFNIRKGSYRYQPFDHLVEREASAY
ncbi:MAG: hypothetical protein L0Y38_04315, partial [Methylococcaceae bacterium]|nr:hypothetical protein [Methylococcaceae bacterium]